MTNFDGRIITSIFQADHALYTPGLDENRVIGDFVWSFPCSVVLQSIKNSLRYKSIILQRVDFERARVCKAGAKCSVFNSSLVSAASAASARKRLARVITVSTRKAPSLQLVVQSNKIVCSINQLYFSLSILSALKIDALQYN